MNRNVLKKIDEWEYPNNTCGKRMPYIISMKGNTLKKLKEGDTRKNIREEDVLNILKDVGIT